ncbi:MAG: cell division protein FtsB [Gammaproteobacteria bacterium]|nr:cell division protein FtsB [Gammaproteobacteria bacterium]
MRALIAFLVLLLLVLQFKLWFGDGGLLEVRKLREEIAAQQAENEELRERNAALEAEVTDLKQGLAAIEERARSELGMVVRGETFYQLVEEPQAPPPEESR